MRYHGLAFLGQAEKNVGCCENNLIASLRCTVHVCNDLELCPRARIRIYGFLKNLVASLNLRTAV